MVTVSKAPGARAGFVTALTGLYAADTPGVKVIYGSRAESAFELRDVAAVLGEMEVEVSHPTLGRTPARSQHERMTLTVLFASWRAGTGQQLVTERAYALYDAASEHFRLSPNETLGLGGRVEVRTTGHRLVEDSPEESPFTSLPDDQDLRLRSRFASIYATWQIDARI